MAKQKDVQDEMDEMDVEETKVVEEKEDKKTKDEIKKENLAKLRIEENKITTSWKDSLKKGDMIQEPEYFQMRHYLNMAINNDEHGAIILSRAGTGKTTTTLTYLTKKGIDYAYMNSFSTVTMFYIWLYKNRNKVKVMDDVHKILESDKFSPFLKAILEGYNGRRIVFYNSSKPVEDVDGQYPNSFEETGSTIILTNKINSDNMHIDAILSRVPVCELNISNERMLELMAVVAKQPYKDLTLNESMEVLNYCKEELRNSVDLNLRTFNHARNFYSYAKKEKDQSLWKRLIKLSLKRDDTDLIILNVITDDHYENDEIRLEAINEQLTKPIGRATFYRKKKELLVTAAKEKKSES